MSFLKLNKKLDHKFEIIIEKLAELKEIAADKPDDFKKQTLEYIASLITQVDAFEQDLNQPVEDEWEKEMRSKLTNPEKYEDVAIEDIPLKKFKQK